MLPKKLLNEAQLLKDVARGDTTAFRSLYEHYQHKLYGYSFGMTKSRSQSEDIVQEAFMKIWINRAELEKIACFDAYIFSTVRHRILNLLKQSSHHFLANRRLSIEMPHADSSTEESLDYLHLVKKVQVLIEQLPPQQKSVYMLSRDLGLKQEEIAERMGIAVSTVKKHLTMALIFIRKNLDLGLVAFMASRWMNS